MQSASKNIILCRQAAVMCMGYKVNWTSLTVACYCHAAKAFIQVISREPVCTDNVHVDTGEN